MSLNLKTLVRQPASASQRVAKNTGILYAKMGITVFISLYTTRLILNSLGIDDFGIFGLLGGAIAMLGFLNSAMGAATQRFISYAEGEGNKEKQKSVFNVSVVLHFLIAIFMGLVLFIVGYFFLEYLEIAPQRLAAARIIYNFMILSTMLSIMTVPYEAVVNAHENMLYYAIVGIVESLLKLSVAFVVVHTIADKLIVYGILMTCISFIVMTLMRIYCHKKYEECEFRPRKWFDKQLMREMTSFSGWSLLGSQSSLLAIYGQGIVINKFFGTNLNAAMNVANQIEGQLYSLATTLMRALNPVILKSEGAGNRELMFKAAISGSKIAVFLIAFISIPIIIEMPYLLTIWLKNPPEFAIIFCRLTLISGFFDFFSTPIRTTIVAHGNIKKYEIVFSSVCSLPLIVVFFLFYIGFAPYFLYIVFLIYSAISLGITLYFAWRNFAFPIAHFLKKAFCRTWAIILIVSSISAIPLLFFESNFLRLLLVLFVSSATCLLGIWFLGFEDYEKAKIKEFISPVVSRVFRRK